MHPYASSRTLSPSAHCVASQMARTMKSRSDLTDMFLRTNPSAFRNAVTAARRNTEFCDGCIPCTMLVSILSTTASDKGGTSGSSISNSAMRSAAYPRHSRAACWTVSLVVVEVTRSMRAGTNSFHCSYGSSAAAISAAASAAELAALGSGLVMLVNKACLIRCRAEGSMWVLHRCRSCNTDWTDFPASRFLR
jgi:hypothetical protein